MKKISTDSFKILNVQKRLKTKLYPTDRLTIRRAHEDQIKRLKKQYKKEVEEEKERKDKESIEAFKIWREKVIQYRKKKHHLTLSNLEKQKEINEIVDSERERLRRERNQKRINMEL